MRGGEMNLQAKVVFLAAVLFWVAIIVFAITKAFKR